MAVELALQWFRDHVDALGTNGESHRFDSPDHADLQVPASQAGDSLKAWLVKQGLPSGPCVVILPRDSVVVRRLKVPAVSDNELAELVRFQTATKTSAPIDSLVLDYLPLTRESHEEGLEVVTVAIDKDRLNRIESVCTAAGLEIQRVTLSSLSIGDLLHAIGETDLGHKSPDLVVYQHRDLIELSVFERGSLVFSHSFNATDLSDPASVKGLNTEMTRSLMALSQSGTTSQVTRCYYLSGAPLPQIQELLERRFGAGLKVISDPHLSGKQVAPGTEALAGVLYAKPDPRLRLDLLHPRKRIDAPDRRRLYYSLGAVSLVLLLTLAVMTFYSKKSALTSEMALIDETKRKQTADIEANKPVDLIHKAVAEWNSSAFPISKEWNELQDNFPGTDRVYLKEVLVTPSNTESRAKIVLKGAARNLSEFQKLTQNLYDSGYISQSTPTPTLGKSDPDYQQEFTINVDSSRKPVSRPDVSSSPVAPSQAATIDAKAVTTEQAKSDSKPEENSVTESAMTTPSEMGSNTEMQVTRSNHDEPVAKTLKPIPKS